VYECRGVYERERERERERGRENEVCMRWTILPEMEKVI